VTVLDDNQGAAAAIASDAAAGATPDQSSGASLDKVRDILFGVQMREYDRRLARLEERLVKETADLKDDVRKRIEALDSYVKRESESLADRDEQLAKTQRDLRQQILDQHQQLTDDIQQRIGDVLAILNREAQELRTEKADRATLASLLTEMALRLTNDWRIPGAEGVGNA
jgi:1,6-anhydro-N-acetylmuramate kinase